MTAWELSKPGYINIVVDRSALLEVHVQEQVFVVQKDYHKLHSHFIITENLLSILIENRLVQ